MLRKLLKYEIKATARIFLPLYAALMVFAIINKVISLVLPNEWQIPKAISTAVYVMILIGMFVMTAIVMIQRFYKNLLSDEGYLMFTLPTATWKHIACKLTVSVMWIAASTIAAFMSISVIAFEWLYNSSNIQAVRDAISSFFEYAGVSSALLVPEILIAGLANLISVVLMIYAAIAVGHLFSRHRVLASLGAFVALSTITQILFALAGSIPGSVSISMNITNIDEINSIMPFLHFIAWYLISYYLILAAGFYAIINYVLSRRLNLE